MSIIAALYQAWKKGQGSDNVGGSEQPTRDDYWNIPFNQATRADISPPSATESNFFFTRQEWDIIRAEVDNNTTLRDEIYNGDTAVSEAIKGKIRNNNSDKINAYNKIIADFDNDSYVRQDGSGYTEHFKNVFGLSMAAAIVYDLCKDALSLTQKRALYDTHKEAFESSSASGDWLLGSNDRFVTGHPATFAFHLCWIHIAYNDIEPGNFEDLKNGLFANNGFLEVINYFAQSGTSPYGVYTRAKMMGLLSIDYAFRNLLPEGRTLVHPNVRFVGDELLYLVRPNKYWNLDGGELNGNDAGSENNSTGLYNYPVYDSESLINIHNAIYRNPIINKLAQDNPQFSDFWYTRFVTKYINAASKILRGNEVAQNYDQVPKIKRTNFPFSKTIYKSRHVFGSDDNNLPFFGVDFQRNEESIFNHKSRSVGFISVYLANGHLVAGTTGRYPGNPYLSHAYNWNKGSYGNFCLGIEDNRDDWDLGLSSNRIAQFGPRYVLGGRLEPRSGAELFDPARGGTVATSRKGLHDDIFNPTWWYDQCDLSEAYRGDGNFFHNRADYYTRSLLVLPGVGGLGTTIVIDRYKVDGAKNNFVNVPLVNQPSFVTGQQNLWVATPELGNSKAYIKFLSSETGVNSRYINGWGPSGAPSDGVPVPEEGAPGHRLNFDMQDGGEKVAVTIIQGCQQNGQYNPFTLSVQGEAVVIEGNGHALIHKLGEGDLTPQTNISLSNSNMKNIYISCHPTAQDYFKFERSAKQNIVI